MTLPRGIGVTVVAACAAAAVWVGGVAGAATPRASSSRAPATHAASSDPAGATVSLRHAGHPDFSGTWTLDTLRSEFGKMPGGRPRSRTDVIAHRDPRLEQTLYLDNAVRRDTTAYRYTTDSTRAVNRVDGRDIEARVWWEGSVLRLESKTRLLAFEMSLRERWTLAPDGKTLTMARRVKYPLGEGEQRLVFVRR